MVCMACSLAHPKWAAPLPHTVFIVLTPFMIVSNLFCALAGGGFFMNFFFYPEVLF